MKAWLTVTWGDVRSIYAARTRAQARYATWREARSAGFYLIKFGDIRVVRCPQHDDLAANCKEPRWLKGDPE